MVHYTLSNTTMATSIRNTTNLSVAWRLICNPLSTHASVCFITSWVGNRTTRRKTPNDPLLEPFGYATVNVERRLSLPSQAVTDLIFPVNPIVHRRTPFVSTCRRMFTARTIHQKDLATKTPVDLSDIYLRLQQVILPLSAAIQISPLIFLRCTPIFLTVQHTYILIFAMPP